MCVCVCVCGVCVCVCVCVRGSYVCTYSMCVWKGYWDGVYMRVYELCVCVGGGGVVRTYVCVC